MRIKGKGTMSQLPPYSTFRTDSKQMMFPQATSHGNILTFTPPGFKQQLNVKFPDSRLAVCEKCKKNFKTKDMCRVRNSHTAPPWTTAYVCITVDDSCTDEEGKFIDKPMTLRMVTWRPYAVRKPFHQKTPVCAGCKRTNRTRSFCRERHKHRQLPWCTVYVLLSALDQADPSTVVAGPSKPVSDDGSTSPTGSQQGGEEGKAKDGGDGSNDQPNGDTKRAPSVTSIDAASATSETISSDADDPGDDINDIPESRTFLAKVSSRGSSIHWLDLVEYDETSTTPSYATPEAGASAFTTPAMTPPPMDPNTAQAHYYAQAHYAQQQHQNALKSHQQYFFHMQQRQHQQYAQWQQQYAQQMAQGAAIPAAAGGPEQQQIQPAPVTAGEAAAASQQRRQGESDAGSPAAAAAAAVTASPPLPGQPQPQQHQVAAPWPMYYSAQNTGYYSPPSATHPGAPAAAVAVAAPGMDHPVQADQPPDQYQAAAVPVTAVAGPVAAGMPVAAAAAQPQYPLHHQPHLHHHTTTTTTGETNPEDEPDAKRHRAI